VSYRSVKEIGEEVYVPDTSVIINGVLRRLIVDGKIKGRLVIPKEFIQYYENIVKSGRSIGYIGLEEIRLVKAIAESKGLRMDIISSGRRFQDSIDSLIRDLALELGAILITSSKVQQVAAESLGIKVMFIKPEMTRLTLLEKFFDSKTMSVHLKEGARPVAKKGRPGHWILIELSNEPVTRE